MKYKHIIWDWNGTLLDDVKASFSALRDMLEKRNMGTLTLEEYSRRIVFPTIQLYYEAGFDVEKESYERICDEYIQSYVNYSDRIGLHRDAEEVLSRFKNKGLGQHIVSASGNDILNEQISWYRLGEYFENILGQDNNHAESKAHLAKRLSRIISCVPEEALFIGDTVHDFEVALECGFSCHLVSNSHCDVGRLKATGVPVYPNLTALYEALDSKGEI